MKVLAIEMSTMAGSVALLEDDATVAAVDMPRAQARTSTLFETLEQVRSAAGWAWDEVELFAAGRGPGRYSGMRVALTAAQGLALPGRRPVRAVSSGAALAHALAAAHPDRHSFAVLGDARRERVWLGVFERHDAKLAMTRDWQLSAFDELAGLLPGQALCASSEWDRLQPGLTAAGLSERTWVREDVYPSAEWVGRLTLSLERSADQGEPLLPIYLHPAVNAP